MTPTTPTSALAIRAKSRIASSFAHNPSNMPPIASSSARSPTSCTTMSGGLGLARLLIAVSTTFLLIFCYLAPQLLQNFCESFLSICSTMSGKGRLVRKFRHFFAKFWYILEIFAKFCLIKPSFAKFPKYWHVIVPQLHERACVRELK